MSETPEKKPCTCGQATPQEAKTQQFIPCPIGPRPPVCAEGFLYGVLPGQTLFMIGQGYGIREDVIIAANPQVVNPNLILPGQVVCVPTIPPVERPPMPPMCEAGCLYGVQAGETLFLIGQTFEVTLTAMLAANPQITDPDALIPSQVVCVPTGPIEVIPCPIGPAAPVCEGGFLYGVQATETLFSIGQAYGVTLAGMIAANPQIANPNLLFPGQVICVPTTATVLFPPPPADCVGCFYGVQPGDTIFFIAARFGVTQAALIAANPQLANPNILVPRQVLCVPVGEAIVDVCPIGPAPVCETGCLYGVQPDESLFLIGRRFGVSVNEMIEANPQIEAPYSIYPGQVVCVPVVETASRPGKRVRPGA